MNKHVLFYLPVSYSFDFIGAAAERVQNNTRFSYVLWIERYHDFSINYTMKASFQDNHYYYKKSNDFCEQRHDKLQVGSNSQDHAFKKLPDLHFEIRDNEEDPTTICIFEAL